MSLSIFLTNIVKEEGITNEIIQMKEIFETGDKIEEHIKRNRNILNEIKKYNLEYNFCINMDGSIDWINYSDLNDLNNKYSTEIRDNIMTRFGLEIERLYIDFEQRLENGEVSDQTDFLVYVDGNMEIQIMEQIVELTYSESEDEELNDSETRLSIHQTSCEGGPYNPYSDECYCSYCN